MKPTHVDITDSGKMVEVFQYESDRGAAVLAGSYVDNYLGLYLKSKMVESSLEGKIFGPQGSLSSFSQRIDFSEAFGYLPKNTCAKLHIIRKIRNHFAHHPLEASFSRDPIKGYIDALENLKELKVKFPGNKFKLKNPKTIYLVSIGLIIAIIYAKMKNA